MHAPKRETSTPQPLHSIARAAAEALRLIEGVLRLGAEAFTALKARLASLADSKEIEWAARSLVISARRLEKLGFIEAAWALIDLAATASPALWLHISTRSAERGSAVASEVDRLLGSKRPKFSANRTPAAGSIRLGTLHPVPRRA